MRRVLAVMLCLLMLFGAAYAEEERQNLVFYEIFTGSFSDSNGDGIGDLQGITGRLDYLSELGIEGIWLTPIFDSPSYHKYDINDYYTVDPDFGTEEDLKALIDGCHARGIRLILDLPINHTSLKNVWFQRFCSARRMGMDWSKYYDFYTCVTENEKQGGHVYYPIDGTEFFYEGNFSQDMPELNWDSEQVRQAGLDIAKYYLEMGVDGFRFDAAKYIYYGDHAASVAFWEWYTGELREMKEDIWLVAEVWDGDGTTDRYQTCMNCFDFTMSQAEGLIAKTASAGNVNRYTAYVQEYLDRVKGIREGATIVPFIANHDMDRAAGYLPDTNGRIRVAANLYILGPGAPFIYYGEEIGLRGSRGGANTDANRRLAMRWGDGDTVQDPVGADYEKQTEATVASMMENENSLLRYYQKLIALRKANPEIYRGTYTALSLADTKMGGFISEWEDSRVLVLHNTTTREMTLDMAEYGLEEFNVIAGTAGGEAKIEGGAMVLAGQTSVIVRTGQ